MNALFNVDQCQEKTCEGKFGPRSQLFYIVEPQQLDTAQLIFTAQGDFVVLTPISIMLLL